MRIVVAGMPRCGTTMLIRSIAGLPEGGTFPTGPFFGVFNKAQEIPSAPFIKTHLPAPAKIANDSISIFMFGNPMEAVLSTMKNRWDTGHFRNCGWVHPYDPQILDRDDLGYEKMFDSWTSNNDYSVLAIRYETIWDHVGLIEKYIGARISLPKARARKTTVSSQMRKHLTKTYGRLDKKVSTAPDIFLCFQGNIIDLTSLEQDKLHEVISMPCLLWHISIRLLRIRVKLWLSAKRVFE